MSPLEELKKNIGHIEGILRYVFSNKELIVQSFIHRSFVNENKESVNQSNERLEFLGDAILGAVVSDFLFNFFPKETEGKLSVLRSELVESLACSRYLLSLNLEKYILLGKGEILTLRGRKNIFADVFEAIVAAVYLDGGYEKAKAFILLHWEQTFQEILQSPARNYKAQLQDHFQKNYQESPVYQVLKETGPQHQKVFHVAVFFKERELGLGYGPTKKEAEQMAAKEALTKVVDEI